MTKTHPLVKRERIWIAASALILFLGLAILIFFLTRPYQYPYDPLDSRTGFGEEEWVKILTIPEYRLVLMTDRQLAQAVADIPQTADFLMYINDGLYSAEEYTEELKRTSNALRALIGRKGGGTALYQVIDDTAWREIYPYDASRLAALRSILYLEDGMWEELTEDQKSRICRRLPEKVKRP